MIQVTISKDIPESSSIVLLATKESDFGKASLSEEEIYYVKTQIDAKSTHIALSIKGCRLFVQLVDTTNMVAKEKEKMRRDASNLHSSIIQQKIQSLAVVDMVGNAVLTCAFAEGMAL